MIDTLTTSELRSGTTTRLEARRSAEIAGLANTLTSRRSFGDRIMLAKVCSAIGRGLKSSLLFGVSNRSNCALAVYRVCHTSVAATSATPARMQPPSSSQYQLRSSFSIKGQALNPGAALPFDENSVSACLSHSGRAPLFSAGPPLVKSSLRLSSSGERRFDGEPKFKFVLSSILTVLTLRSHARQTCSEQRA